MSYLRAALFFVSLVVFTYSLPIYAQGNVKPRATDIEDLQRALEVTQGKLKLLESKLNDRSKARNFHVIAFFKFDEIQANKLLGDSKSAIGKSLGMPTLNYDWICPTPNCEGMPKSSNMYWKNPKDSKPVKAPMTGWSHIAVRTFSTSAEADAWLTDTKEGQFVAKYAVNVLSTSTTAYYD
jgi:hypothetical protein